MKQLYLVRHCETLELAGEEPAMPRGDSPLSPKGVAQARAVAERLAAWPLDLVLTSLYLRAVQTARIVAEGRQAPVHASLALNEFLLRDDHEGVETVEQGLVRSLGFLNQFRPYHEHVMVVGHNSILSVLRMSLLNAPYDANHQYFADPGRCCILRYAWERGDQNWREIESFAP
jgi:broad specificity phosphatase PhoE